MFKTNVIKLNVFFVTQTYIQFQNVKLNVSLGDKNVQNFIVTSNILHKKVNMCVEPFNNLLRLDWIGFSFLHWISIFEHL